MSDTKETLAEDDGENRGTHDEINVEQTLDVPQSENQFGETIAYLSPGESTDDADTTATKSEVPKSIGRYEIRGVLGRGTYGAVYRGYDSQLDRQVAIKVPVIGAQQSKQNVEELFLREARQLAQLTHPNVVTVYDVGVDDGVCFIVSDFLEGPDLNDWLQDRKPSWQETVRIAASISDGLAEAHSRSTVHRDVKPANIIVTQRAEGLVPVLVDFGLALSDSNAAIADAQRGRVSGTPNFMSPEQAQGEGHRIDGRTDIYALGVILYRMLSG